MNKNFTRKDTYYITIGDFKDLFAKVDELL